MEAGRNLDAWVAEKVMGWRVFKTTREWQKAGSPSGRQQTVLDQTPRFEVPNYSTDIAAAWQVVEKLHLHSERAYVIEIRLLLEDWFEVEIKWDERGDGNEQTVWSGGTAVTLAICLAALKAVGVDIDTPAPSGV